MTESKTLRQGLRQHHAQSWAPESVACRWGVGIQTREKKNLIKVNGDCFDAVAFATAADAASPIEHIDSVINGCIQALLHTQRKMAKVDLSKVGIFDAAAEDGAADRTLW